MSLGRLTLGLGTLGALSGACLAAWLALTSPPSSCSDSYGPCLSTGDAVVLLIVVGFACGALLGVIVWATWRLLWWLDGMS